MTLIDVIVHTKPGETVDYDTVIQALQWGDYNVASIFAANAIRKSPVKDVPSALFGDYGKDQESASSHDLVIDIDVSHKYGRELRPYQIERLIHYQNMMLHEFFNTDVALKLPGDPVMSQQIKHDYGVDDLIKQASRMGYDITLKKEYTERDLAESLVNTADEQIVYSSTQRTILNHARRLATTIYGGRNSAEFVNDVVKEIDHIRDAILSTLKDPKERGWYLERYAEKGNDTHQGEAADLHEIPTIYPPRLIVDRERDASLINELYKWSESSLEALRKAFPDQVFDENAIGFVIPGHLEQRDGEGLATKSDLEKESQERAAADAALDTRIHQKASRVSLDNVSRTLAGRIDELEKQVHHYITEPVTGENKEPTGHIECPNRGNCDFQAIQTDAGHDLTSARHVAFCRPCGRLI